MKKRLAATALSLCLITGAIPQAYAASFSDVPDTHWSYSFVEKAAENGLVQGIGGGLYGVERTVSNAEWVTMVCNLFYADSVAGYLESGGRTDHWWTPYLHVGMLFTSGTTVGDGRLHPVSGEFTQAVVEAGISRYDMAQIIFNIANRQSWREVDASQVSAQIADWSSVPEQYWAAVAYCFAAGFVSGTDSNGTFDGGATMTRGAGAVVLCRMLDAKNGTHDFGICGLPLAPEKTEGTLANGRPITDENIAAILAEYEALYPDGTTWGQERTYSSKTFGYGAACDAWAYMISDALWGEATYTKHNDLTQVKPGDIVYLYNQERHSGHWIVVMETGTEPYTSTPYMVTCEGNVNGKVSWNARRFIPVTTTENPDSSIYTFY